jgi:hypothetical protein
MGDWARPVAVCRLARVGSNRSPSAPAPSLSAPSSSRARVVATVSRWSGPRTPFADGDGALEAGPSLLLTAVRANLGMPASKCDRILVHKRTHHSTDLAQPVEPRRLSGMSRARSSGATRGGASRDGHGLRVGGDGGGGTDVPGGQPIRFIGATVGADAARSHARLRPVRLRRWLRQGAPTR